MLNIQHRRHLALGLAVTVALTIVLLLQQIVPAAPVMIGTVPTGASFNLAVATLESPQQANIVVANVRASGLPVFVRTLSRGGWRQVIVGPFVSIDEAEAAQGTL